MEGSLTERSFLEYLHELDHKIVFLYEKPPHDIKCFNEVHDVLYKLKIKVNSTMLCAMRWKKKRLKKRILK